MGKATGNYTPEQRAAMLERERLLKAFGEKYGLKDAQERLRQFGEKHGLNKLGRAETAPAKAQRPPPKRGRKGSIEREQCKRGIKLLQSQPKMTVDAARATLRAAGIEGSDSALYRLIIEPSGISK
jgi:hypothetical protein